MKKSIIALTISFCFLFACTNSNNSRGNEAIVITDSSLQQNISTPVTGTPVQMQPAPKNEISPAPAAATASSPASQTSSVAADMNPAHGEPGHRCDIAVGAPLNSPPTKTVTPSISSRPATTAAGAPVTAAPVVTAPGMNPPHGQPGHDCAIPVGSPLKK